MKWEMNRKYRFVEVFLFVFILVNICSIIGCTADGDPVSIDPIMYPSSSSKGQPDSGIGESSSSQEGSETVDPKSLADYLDLVDIPESKLTRGSAIFSVNAFKMAKTEVTQKLYAEVMGKIPNQAKTGDNLPVTGVNWYESVLFANALSKAVGLDTAYIYTSVGSNNFLENLAMDFSVKAVRLPTESEWEVAARAGTPSAYYWGTDVASKYANYRQINNSVVEVASLIPNDFGLYDMAGNASEWINDWYGAYPATSVQNPTGPSSGEVRCVRGGSWADDALALASGERSSKAPLYSSAMLGFRVVYSSGF